MSNSVHLMKRAHSPSRSKASSTTKERSYDFGPLSLFKYRRPSARTEGSSFDNSSIAALDYMEQCRQDALDQVPKFTKSPHGSPRHSSRESSGKPRSAFKNIIGSIFKRRSSDLDKSVKSSPKHSPSHSVRGRSNIPNQLVNSEVSNTATSPVNNPSKSEKRLMFKEVSRTDIVKTSFETSNESLKYSHTTSKQSSNITASRSIKDLDEEKELATTEYDDLIKDLGSMELNTKITSIDQSRSSTIAPVLQRGLSRSLSREFEQKFETKKYEIIERSRSQTRQIVETNRVYSRTGNNYHVISPWGKPVFAHTKVNQYQIFERIGHGSNGSVFLALDDVSQEFFACKIITKKRYFKSLMFSRGPGKYLTPDEMMAKLKHEVAVLKRASNHPKIISLCEVLDDSQSENLYLFFEWCERGPVMVMRPKTVVPAFTEDVARKYFRDIVLGLEFCNNGLTIVHFKGIIHCDLKPENIFVRADGTAQIGDFGISMILKDAQKDKIWHQNTTPTITSPAALARKTLIYIADKGKISGKPADIWALGITLYCFVHGHCPFEGEDEISTYIKIETEEPVYSPTLSKSIENLLMNLLNKNDSKRIQMDKIKIHPWVTQNGKNTMLSTKENCPEETSDDELDGVFKPAFLGVQYGLTKVMNGMFGKQRKSEPQVVPSPSRGIRQATVKIVQPTHSAKNISDTSISNIRKEQLATPHGKNNKSF